MHINKLKNLFLLLLIIGVNQTYPASLTPTVPSFMPYQHPLPILPGTGNQYAYNPYASLAQPYLPPYANQFNPYGSHAPEAGGLAALAFLAAKFAAGASFVGGIAYLIGSNSKVQEIVRHYITISWTLKKIRQARDSFLYLFNRGKMAQKDKKKAIHTVRKQEIQNLTTQLHTTQTDLAVLQTNFDNKEREYAVQLEAQKNEWQLKLSTVSDRALQNDKKASEWEIKYKTLEQERNQFRNTIEMQRQQYEKLSQEKMNSSDNRKSAEQKLEAVSKEKSTLKDVYKTKIEKLKNYKKELNAQLKTLQETTNKKINDLQNEKNTLLQEKIAYQSKLTYMQESLNELKKKNYPSYEPLALPQAPHNSSQLKSNKLVGYSIKPTLGIPRFSSEKNKKNNPKINNPYEKSNYFNSDFLNDATEFPRQYSSPYDDEESLHDALSKLNN